jgi:phosphoribosyl-ATP pyrophosphohydrolase/phosphoribosyl-AMP cyclohydrolase
MSNDARVIDFPKMGGLVPAIVQHAETGVVLMLGYMNEEALAKTVNESRVHFFSRSKNRLWMKGESSGHILEYRNHSVDCDGDAILVSALPHGPTCHTGSSSCFDGAEHFSNAFLSRLNSIIHSRKSMGDASRSYVANLFSKGTKSIAQKVIEEAGEVALEAMADERDLFVGEAADLLFHYLVLLADQGVQMSEVLSLLESRHGERQSS